VEKKKLLSDKMVPGKISQQPFNLLDVESRLNEMREKIEKDGDRLIESAKNKAREILAKAIKERETLAEEARKDGFEKGFESGRKEGFEKAHSEMIEESRESFQEKTEQLQTFIAQLPEKLSEERHLLVDEARRDVLKLILELVDFIVKKELEAPSELVKKNLNEAIGHLVERRKIIVELHPEMKKNLEMFLPEIQARFSDIESLRFVENENLKPAQLNLKNSLTEYSVDPEDTFKRICEDWGF
jgi:flagellar biosynthesis/type III secretory pathway protein FliH